MRAGEAADDPLELNKVVGGQGGGLAPGCEMLDRWSTTAAMT
jgi:hypothetical protein